jgi:hypothetical protein
MATKVSWKDKVEQAQKGSGTAEGSSIATISRNIKLWVISTIVLGYYSLTKKQPAHDRQDSNTWYYYTASVFGIGIFFSFLAFISAKTNEKKALSKVLFYCNVIAMSTYLLSAARLTHALPSILGHPVEIGRYLEWVTTCPVLILLIGEITKCQEIAAVTMRYDYTMLCFGFLASITRQPFSFTLVMICFAYFSMVLYGLEKMFRLAIEGKTDCNLDIPALTAAKYGTLCAWSACKYILTKLH